MDEIVGGELVGDISGTVMSVCNIEPGIVGNSVYFDGVSAWVDLGNQRHRYVFNIMQFEFLCFLFVQLTISIENVSLRDASVIWKHLWN